MTHKNTNSKTTVVFDMPRGDKTLDVRIAACYFTGQHDKNMEERRKWQNEMCRCWTRTCPRC